MRIVRGMLTLAVVTVGFHALRTGEAATASRVVVDASETEVTGLPAFAPSLGLLLIQDPPDLVGQSDCIDICGLNVKSGAITSQWSRRPPPANAVLPLSPLQELQSVTRAHRFDSLEPLQLADTGKAVRRYTAGGVALTFDPRGGEAIVHDADRRKKVIPLPSRDLMCDDDPETDARNVSRLTEVSDVAVWSHAASGLMVLRTVYLGNDRTCSRAGWLVVRP